MRKIKLFWKYQPAIYLMLFLGTLQLVNAEDLYHIYSFNGQFNSEDGSMTLTIPVYDCAGGHEAVQSGSQIRLVSGSDSYTLLDWRSTDANGCDEAWQSSAGQNHSHWGKFTANTTNTAAIFVEGQRISYANQVINALCSHSEAPASVKIYLASYLLEKYEGKGITITVVMRWDEDSDSKCDVITTMDNNVNIPSWSTPTVGNPTFSTTAGMYDVSFNVQAKAGSQYSWNGSSYTEGASATASFNIADVLQTKTLYFRHRVSEYQTVNKTVSYTLPAYQQPKSFSAGNLYPDNGDTRLTWTVAGSQSSQQTGDAFEVQRSTDVGFVSPVTVGTVNYNPAQTSYELIDNTSNDNLNGPVYYRIRRTKASSWNWAVCQTAQIQKSMSHKGILNESVRVGIDDNNRATVSWAFDNGNVISNNSQIIVERINLITQKIDKISLPFALTTTSYTEELTAMCQEFRYDISVVPGNTKYTAQEPVVSRLTDPNRRIIPLRLGNIPALNASKGYFSDRVDLEWDLTDGAVETFAITRRLYGSTDEFKQIDVQSAYEASKSYTYTDATGIPGQIYEYRIAGLTSCADGVHDTYSPVSIGFRTPTGDVYGRVTFENGQAVENVEINVVTEEIIRSRSLAFTSGATASITDTDLLTGNTDSVTLQAWVAPNAVAGTQKVISKDGMYELGINNNLFYFKAGTAELKTDALQVSDVQAGGTFMHLTGVYDGNRLLIYVNGKLIAKTTASVSLTGNTNPVQFGGSDFAGVIDEVRIWNRALSAEEIARDYNRYLTGNESGLIAYYTFNYAVDTEFYDISFAGTVYNENHGALNAGVTLSENVPTVDQLGYRGITAADGSYSVRSIPYQGNGTAYQIVPRLGIHSFESAQEVRFIGNGAQSHTVNFTDKSSFRVQGFVSYQNATIPVEGVSFEVDGKPVLRTNGTPEASGADGEFIIRVPVGTHEVKAVKANHTFVNDGRITDPYGQDRNYQDAISGLELEDNTTVKFIGRVAGGTIQEAYPIGHSLSTNNLAEGITVTLTHTKTETLVFDDKTVTETHFKPSNAAKAHVNEVEYTENKVIIHVNDTTGEFVANVIPEQFNLRVAASGHDQIAGSGELLNLSQSFGWQDEVYAYRDSIRENGEYRYTSYSDTVKYQAKKKFIKRYTPEIRVSQVNSRKETLPYFGSDTIAVTNLMGEKINIPLFDGSQYAFGKPVFEQYTGYSLKMELFEKYVFFGSNGFPTGATDEVPTQDAVFKFNNDIAGTESQQATVEADDKGVAFYTFTGGDPDLTSAVRRMELTVTYGQENNQTSINWTAPSNFEQGNAYVVGARQRGVDFVTAGPDKVLTVLRDPPGSHSYAYLEKGVSFSEASTYTGAIHNEGSEEWTAGVKQQILSWCGIGVGSVTGVTDIADGTTVGIVHEEEYQGQDTKSRSTTATTRFQTSAEADYVGADADVYIGYSTNITVGSTDNVTAVSKTNFDAAGGAAYYDEVYTDPNSDWVLVKDIGMSVNQTFNTLFAYPQAHIENRLIPELQNLRNSLLLPINAVDINALQAQVDADAGKIFYVSYFDVESEHFGKSNDDASLKAFRGQAGHGETWTAKQEISFDGPSYKVIYNTQRAVTDSVVYLNQSVEKWIAQMKNNEERKVKADKLQQNYSFHGGSSVEYSESYSNARAHESSFYINVGMHLNTDFDANVFGVRTKFVVDETVYTSQGGTFSSEVERSHSKGFVLEEEGTDYISVDVFYEPNWSREDELYGDYILNDKGNGGMVEESDLADKDFYSSFIFKTRGGATSCPYEGEYVTKYYEPGTHVINAATLQVEVPKIDMPVKFIENVPSGETAKLQLYLRNESESKDDNWYNLKIVNTSNPDGARMYIDGAPIGNGLEFPVAAGETLVKTLEVGKGAILNYDGLQLLLQSQCQEDIADTVTFTVHFIPSCTDVNIKKPGNSWTYNTRLPQMQINGIDKHYMEVLIDGFNVNYDNFGRIELQYKSASQSDDEWTTLMNYYNDSTAYRAAIENGLNAEMILASYAGTIPYRFVMDDMPDQQYDLRAVSVCLINNEEVRNESEVRSGLKDMYLPRLFGSPQPADGILNVEDNIRLNFNEPIADGLLTRNNFTVQGVRNGSITDHSTSIELDGTNDFLATEFEKSFEEKDITVEMWIQAAQPQNATLFSHGNINESLELAVTSDNKLQVRVGSTTITSPASFAYDQGSWAHVALVYEADGYLTAYYNYSAAISRVQVGAYNAAGNIQIGKSIQTGSNPFAGKIHNLRIWEKPVSSTDLQINSLVQLSGIEAGLLGYYPMNEGKGTLANDKARGATLLMNGGHWALPDGFAVATNGSDYLQIESGSAAITKAMDFTIEFWFKAEPGQTNATLLSNGRGDGNDLGGSDYLFNIGLDENGALAFYNNGVKTTVEGDYRDNNWHHFAIGVDRAIGRGQIYMDGRLNTYIDGANIGGVSSPYLYLGARGWYAPENASNLIIDNHFKGQFDDLRFWQLYKNERLVSENNNIKLSGEEKGLIHYYPFDTYIEHQGQKFVEYTNSDKHIASGANPETDQFTVVGASDLEIQSKDIAPLKDAGPLASLEFDFVVNNDALIINLKEPEYKVAKTIVSLTVDDVRDRNGNAIASPITWSAYIDRNQLKWSEDRLNLTKPAYDGLEFTVRAVNNGGSVQRYTIDNIPAWLDVTPSEGKLNPASQEEIHFSVNEGLNIGFYNEVIYLTNEDKVAEALTLNLTVTGEKPDWTVNPADFKYNMSVFGKMRFNNIFSTDKGDMLAVFDNGVCVGVTNSVYNKTLDMWYALLAIYNNNAQAGNLEFRMWDAGTGKTYKAIPDAEIQFVNDAIIGNAENPVIFDGKEIFYRNMALQKGWNWISFNLANGELSDVNKTLVYGKWSGQDVVKGKEYFDSYSASAKKWTGTLSSHNGFNNTSMFMLLSSQEQTLSTSGTAIDTKTMPVIVNGKQWNYIGYLPSVNTTVKEGLAGYDAQKGDVVKSQNRFAMFSKNEWVGDLTYLEANKGYMLYRTATDNTAFTYPSVSGALSNLRSAVIRNEEEDKYLNAAFSENMNIVATTDGLQDGDRILAYINGELRGTGESVATGEQALSFITVGGHEANGNIRFEWQRGDETIGTANTSVSYFSNTISGTIENPLRLDFGISDHDVSVYPNPFQKEFKIDAEAEKDSSIDVKIVDIAGRTVWLQNEKASHEGINTIVVDGSAFTAGVYIVKVTVAGATVARIIEKTMNK